VCVLDGQLYNRIGWQWIAILVGLAVYTLLLLPGFIQVCYYYYSSKSVHRNIVCGDHRRNRLDLHLPGKIDEPKPVVIFVTGGAWIIGHRAWGSLFGKQMAQHGIIVASLDYRNYPHGTASNMVADICSGIAYVRANIASYGGDPEQ
jgi:prenylcysteine alpha-carboxyl methylesterase